VCGEVFRSRKEARNLPIAARTAGLAAI